MATTVIGMSLHRYVLKICFTEYNESFIDFQGKRFELFWEHVSCNLLCRQLIDSVELSSTVRSFSGFSLSAGYFIFRAVYILVISLL